jgi:hypothetical protein
VVSVANRFFETLGDYLHDERPDGVPTERVFVVQPTSMRAAMNMFRRATAGLSGSPTAGLQRG